MKHQAVLVDVSIDQGGCFETSRPTTHSDPTYEVDGITHYCVTNMPGAVPITSTYALTNATIPYVLHLATSGVAAAIAESPGLKLGVNVAGGQVTYAPVAEAVGVPCRVGRRRARGGGLKGPTVEGGPAGGGLLRFTGQIAAATRSTQRQNFAPATLPTACRLPAN